MLAACARVLNEAEHFAPRDGAPPQPLYERYMLTGTDTYLRQQVGLLTTLTPTSALHRSSERREYPIDASSSCGTSSSGSSDVSKHYVAQLYLELPTEGGGPRVPASLVVVGAHLKAIPTQNRSCHKREAQAQILQSLLSDALRASPYVVLLGDLNDFDGDDCCVDVAGSTPTSRVLRMLKDPNGRGSDQMRSVAEALPVAERYTDWWDHAPADGVDQGVGEHSSLDHMLVSTALFEQLHSVRIDHSTRPMDYSDHWPLVARFRLRPLPASAVCQRGVSGGFADLQLPFAAAVPLLAFALIGAITVASLAVRCARKQSSSPHSLSRSLSRSLTMAMARYQRQVDGVNLTSSQSFPSPSEYSAGAQRQADKQGAT
jgi:hypothetical protein